ncbi:restriction endonuclease [Vreelandella olivaria]|uniref:restriction endonuclease n=1 Tax=Vreelandella olivaria TaxID=390919 RepID=UPI00201FAFC5|nr:restriction endonuclease [Halomonas olivaria]
MASSGSDYEKLTQEIYQALSEADGVENIDIQHDVKLEGRSGCKHQIDVYWEFNILGEKHRVAVECKDYKSEVSIGRLRDFFGVLHDLGNVKGVFVTKVGYQSGAKRYADYYDISLKELRFPTASDWEGRVKDIVINITAITPSIKKREPICDNEWIIKYGGFSEGEKISAGGYADQLKIYDSEGCEITSFHEMDSKLPHDWKPEVDKEHTYEFDDAYIHTDNGKRLKITGVKYQYDILSGTDQSVTEGELIAKAILKDVQSGGIHFYDKNGNIRPKRT